MTERDTLRTSDQPPLLASELKGAGVADLIHNHEEHCLPWLSLRVTDISYVDCGKKGFQD